MSGQGENRYREQLLGHLYVDTLFGLGASIAPSAREEIEIAVANLSKLGVRWASRETR